MSENSGEKALLGSSGCLLFQLEFSLSAHSFLEKGHRLINAKSLASDFPPRLPLRIFSQLHALGCSGHVARPHHSHLMRPNGNSLLTPKASQTFIMHGLLQMEMPTAEQESLVCLKHPCVS